MAHRIVCGRIEADVSRLVAEHNPELRRKSAAFAGRLASEIIAAFLDLSRERQNALSDNSNDLAQNVVRRMLSAPQREEERVEQGEEAPWYLEDWAGPVAGPTVIERDFGISRSTLYHWQRKRFVIAFQKGRRKFVFPLRQFVDGRPVNGLNEILAIVPDHRAAWTWLIQENDALGAAPLDLLRSGRQNDVVTALGKEKPRQLPAGVLK